MRESNKFVHHSEEIVEYKHASDVRSLLNEYYRDRKGNRHCATYVVYKRCAFSFASLCSAMLCSRFQ